jgi:Ca2+-binding EF-hand superfamily protein
MDTSKLVRAVLLVASMMLAAVATAAVQNVKDKFNNLDRNGDGYIDRSEATLDNSLREHWNNVDKDNNGRVNMEEFKKFEKVPDEPFPQQ